jgi:hypothetical protein
MASKTPSTDGMTEACEACGRQTRHEVSVELRTESDDDQNAQFSREPYRVTRCCECDRTESQRMNNA